jgi:hypothetical protein
MRRKKTTRRRPTIPARASDPYWLGLDDAELEQLTDAICPESVALKCWEVLRWRRDGHRNEARGKAKVSRPSISVR